MRRIVLPSTGVGIGGETIAKILFCPDLAEPESRLRSGIGIHEECLSVAEGATARGLDPLLNRGLLIPRHCTWAVLMLVAYDAQQSYEKTKAMPMSPKRCRVLETYALCRKGHHP